MAGSCNKVLEEKFLFVRGILQVARREIKQIVSSGTIFIATFYEYQSAHKQKKGNYIRF